MKSFLFAVLALTGFLASAEDQTIPAQPNRYSIVTTRGSTCLGHDLSCRANLRHQTINDAQVASHDYCKNNFGNLPKVIDWKADCTVAMLRGLQNPPYPQPPPPDMPKPVSCWAQFDFVCE